MTAAQRRAARRERTAAAALGTTRIVRQRGESAPDLRAFELPDGTPMVVEVKDRAELPKLHQRALEQARGYAPGREPGAVTSERGGEQWITVRLAHYCQVTGLAPTKLGVQLPLALAPPRRD